jgi:hypothetical protein
MRHRTPPFGPVLAPFTALLLTALLAACASGGGPLAHAPAQPAGPVDTVTADIRNGGQGLVYTTNYRLKAPYDADVRAVAVFENPQRGGTPFVTEATIPPGDTRLLLESEPFFTIRNDTDYTVVLTLSQGNAVLATHRDLVRFSVSESLVESLRRRGIEVE